ncbi:MAG TPA: hypothetical protein VM842_06935, partial [Nitrospira sp.]|nr:hypothetical protein [Nitrospira sp.]
MNHFTANIIRLAARYPDLAASLKAARGEVLTIESARNGMPSARRDGRWIHSAYDPLREAETWADSHARACHEGETVVVSGVGLLYHVEAIRKKLSPDIAVAVVISNIDEFHDALSARQLESW